MNFHDIFCPHPSYVYFRCTKNFMKKLNMFIIENKDTIDVQCNSKNEDIFLSHKKLETGVLIETKMLILWNDNDIRFLLPLYFLSNQLLNCYCRRWNQITIECFLCLHRSCFCKPQKQPGTIMADLFF